jgi:dihydrofolate reductase
VLLWHVVMSLDGFIAGPADEMDWVFEYFGPNESVDEVVATTGALIVGRHTYEVEDRNRPGFYGGAFTGPFFVLTHRRPANPPDWMTGTYVNDGIEDAVSRATSAADGKNVVVLGANVAKQCVAAGLLDEILVNVAPILLGDSVRFFDNSSGQPVRLEKVRAAESGS